MKFNMRTLKDKRKFGKGKKPKNRNCKVFGACYGKEYQKWKRKLIKQIKHKLLFNISLNEEETNNLWRISN